MVRVSHDDGDGTIQQRMIATAAYLRATYTPLDLLVLVALMLGWVSVIVWSAIKLDG